MIQLKKKLTLSIIVPVHNSENTLENCLNSILIQDVDEIILVDDHSTDDSEIIMENHKNDPRVHCYKSDGYGVSAARNYGLAHASCDIIGFCDSDDTEEMGMSEIVKKEFSKRQGIEVLITAFNTLVYTDNTVIREVHRIRGEKRFGKEEIIEHVICDSDIMGSVWNKFFKKNILINIEFDRQLTHCEDMDFVIRALLNCEDYDVFASTYITYNYIHREDSATNDLSKIIDHKTGELKYNVAMYKILSLNGISEEIRKYIYYNIFLLSLSHITRYDLPEKTEIILKKHLADYKRYFFSLFRIAKKNNIKCLIKLLFRIRNRRLFAW